MKNTKWIALPLLFRSLAFFPAWLPVAIVSIGVTGCVTVNVNIPEGDVQQASDDYVRELYEAKAKPRPSPSPSAVPLAKPATTSIGDFIISPALADESATQSTGPSAGPRGHAISTRSAKLDDLMTKMRGRLDQIIPLKKAGMLGESKMGKLLLHGKPAQARSKQIKKLLVDENRDRSALYHEILAHNGMSQSNLPTVQRSFAHSFQKHSPAGTWIQDDDGSWSRKK